MNIRKTVRRLERWSEARQGVVMPCQGNMLSGGGHSILAYRAARFCLAIQKKRARGDVSPEYG